MANRARGFVPAVMLAAAVAAGCSTGAASAPPTIAVPSVPVLASDAAITLSAPPEAAAGSSFSVGWTGKETSGDFFVIVPAGATTWTETADSPYYNATIGNPITLTAPKTPGDYEIWFLKGNLGTVIVTKAKAPLKVT